MTDKKQTKKYKELKEELDREFVKNVLSPKWKRGKGESLREIGEAHGLSHEQVRLLLKKYGEY